MKKIAFFVEGLTEQYFIEKLLTQIFGENDIAIEKKKMTGGSSTRTRIISLRTSNVSTNTKYFFLITDCGSDSTVASYIKEQRQSLIKNDYDYIYGILDLKPRSRNDIIKFKKLLKYGIPQKDLPTEFILSIMEIEAWFLSEENHFTQLDPRLSIQFLLNRFNFNPLSNTELINDPADLLHDIYQAVNLSYKKRERQIARTVNILDYANLYFEVPNRVPSLNNLITAIESIF